jgi:hypothetical protein
MTAPGSQEWLKSATSGETDTPTGVSEGEVNAKVFVTNLEIKSARSPADKMPNSDSSPGEDKPRYRTTEWAR